MGNLSKLESLGQREAVAVTFSLELPEKMIYFFTRRFKMPNWISEKQQKRENYNS